MKGLLLGAGASFEVGMPLVWEFTQTLRKNILKRLDTNLFNFKSDQKLKNTFVQLLSDEKLHYEEVVGELETMYLKGGRSSENVHGIIIQLIECIQILLLEDQQLTLKLLAEKVKDYYGIAALVKSQNVLNVFSLNHDIVFEEICDYFKIPMKDGFYKETNKYSHIANFKIITSDQLGNGDLDLFAVDEYGVNLIKLHGALDIFAAEDKKIFLKSCGNASYVGSNYAEIRKVEDRNIEIIQRDGVRATNELYVHDSDGELQFLRRSLLSGAHKFRGSFDQIVPTSLFEFFKKQIKLINELVIIGYSFGDAHINEVICNWLRDDKNTLKIFDPFLSEIPEVLASSSDRITIVQGGLTDYSKEYDSSIDSWVAESREEMLKFVRENLKNKRLGIEG